MKKERFSFRKYGKILAPAVIGLVGITITNTVSANEVQEGAEPTATAVIEPKEDISIVPEGSAGEVIEDSSPLEPVVLEGNATSDIQPMLIETEKINSPVEYITNEYLESGKQNVITKGQEGKLEFYLNQKEEITVKESPATPTTIEVGIQPRVEEKIEKHTISYELDESKFFGDDTVIEGQDKIEKIINYDKLWLLKDPKTFMSEEVLDYKKDPQKRLINAQNQLLGNKATEEEVISSLDTIFSDNSIEGNEKKYEVIDQLLMQTVYKDALFEEILYKNFNVRDYIGKMELEEFGIVVDSLYRRWAIFEKTDQIFNLIPESRDWKSKDDITRYHLSTYIPSFLSEELLHDARLISDIQKYFEEENPTELDTIIEIGMYGWQETLRQKLDRANELIPHLYELSNTEAENFENKVISIEYPEGIPEEFKTGFERYVNNLPAEIRNVIPIVKYFYVDTSDFAGNAHEYTDRIFMNYLVLHNPTAEGNFKTLMHELGHVIDFKSKYYDNGYNFEEYDGVSHVPTLSQSPEWLAIFDEFYKGNRNIWNYIADPKFKGTAHMEAFAESFAQFIFKKVYNREYDRYLPLYYLKDYTPVEYTSPKLQEYIDNDQLLTYAEHEGESEYGDSIFQDYFVLRPGDMGYDVAFDIFSKSEPYFERLYNQLFAQPRLPQVRVAEQDVEIVQERKDGKVIYGAKPTESTTIYKHVVKYQADETKDLGSREVKILGKDGSKITRTTYVLENNKPKVVETIIKDEKAVDGLILIGTKPKETVTTRIEGPITLRDKDTTSYEVDPSTGEIKVNVSKVVNAKLNENLFQGQLSEFDEITLLQKLEEKRSKGQSLEQDKPRLDESLFTMMLIKEVKDKPKKDNIYDLTIKADEGKIRFVEGSIVVPQSEKITGTASSAKVQTLPKTAATTQDTVTLPAGLATALMTAGLLSLRKRKED